MNDTSNRVEVFVSGDHLSVSNGRTIVKVGEPGRPDNLAAAVAVMTAENAIPDICSAILKESGHRLDALPAGGVIHSGISDKRFPDQRFLANATTTFGNPVQITIERDRRIPASNHSVGEVVHFVSAIPFADIAEKVAEDKSDDDRAISEALRHSL